MSISQAVAQHLPYLSRYARALAGKELAAEIATDVLIIEDETFIALDLEAHGVGGGHREQPGEEGRRGWHQARPLRACAVKLAG